MLRNPTYTGRLRFRGRLYQDRHEPLIGPDVFEAVQELLIARGEDASLRATNGSPYLFGGLLRCQACGHPMLGTSARGRSRTYRYYTCYTRQRYGRGACRSARLPSLEVDQAVMRALADTFADSRLIETASAAARAAHDDLAGQD